ncbi:hypothetical protein ACEQ8H_004156 [Pleosporales sp. CAS-2024a]
MASKRTKALRRQAVLRAKECNEKQMHKVDTSIAPVAEKSLAPGTSVIADAKAKCAMEREPKDSRIDPSLSHHQKTTSVVTERTLTRKTLNKRRKERPTTADTVPRDGLDVQQRANVFTHHRAQGSSMQSGTGTSKYSAKGVNRRTKNASTATADTMGKVDSVKPCLVRNNGMPLAPVLERGDMVNNKNEGAKLPFFAAFTELTSSSFTFDAVASKPLVYHAVPTPTLKLKLPMLDSESKTQQLKQGYHVRNSLREGIVHTMNEHAQARAIETELPVSETEGSSEDAQVLSFECFDEAQITEREEPTHQALRFELATDASVQGSDNTTLPKDNVQLGQFLDDLGSNRIFSDLDAVASPVKSIASPSKLHFPSDTVFSPTNTKYENDPSIDRVFFAGMDGHTRLVDFTQSLYDVQITADDGASDFESIYSPCKSIVSTAKFGSPLKFHQEIGNSSSESSDDGIDIDSVRGPSHVGYSPSAQPSGQVEGADTSGTAPSFVEDKHITGSHLEPMPEASPTANDPEAVKWTNELVRTMIGTESLYTFLTHLPADDHGLTSKSAIVTAFLKLVSFEREQRCERPLPQSYATGAVMASKIMPHTIFLGTTCLATFMAGFARSGDEIRVTDVHRVFSTLSKCDLKMRTVATTGFMGVLGRQLGRLPMVYMG